VRDAVACLVAALQLPGQADRTLEIGGPDRFSYADLLRRTAAAIDARVHVRSVPGVPLWVAARGLSAVAGLPIETVRPLVESLPTPAVVTDDAARQAFPFDRTPFAEAVSRAATVDSGTDRDTGGPAGRSAPMSDLPRPPLPEVFE
jgi:uncharacterized protein YbjT (DUF2867 family)